MSQRTRMVTRFHAVVGRIGPAEVVTDPNRVRYVGTEVVRRTMDLADEDAFAPAVEATAAKRPARHLEPVRVASGDHRRTRREFAGN